MILKAPLAVTLLFFTQIASSEYVLSNGQPQLLMQKASTLPKPITRTRLFSDVTTFTSITTVPTTISAAGHYMLANDVTVATTGITIDANNVVLDLDGRNIDGTGGGVNGIIVNGGRSNILIGNGYISNMSQNGILVQGDECTVTNCVLQNNLKGIYLNAATHCTIKECQAFSNTSAGFYLSGATNSFITDCQSINTTSAIAGFGFFTTNGSLNLFDECTAVDTHTTGTTFGIFPTGFAFTGTETQSSITNCESNHTYAPSAGVAQPFGIALNAALTGVTNASQISSGLRAFAVEWTPDPSDSLLAVGGNLDAAANTAIFSYDNDSASLKLLATSSQGGRTKAVSWPSTSSYLAVGREPGTIFPVTTSIYRFDQTKGLSLVTTATDLITTNAVDWSPNNNYLASGLDSGDIAVNQFDRSILWRLDTKNHGAPVRSVKWSHSGSFLAVGGDVTGAEVRIFSFNGSVLTPVTTAAHGGAINSVDWSTNDHYLVVGGEVSSSITTRVYQFDGVNLTQVATANHGATVHSALFSPRTTTVATGGETSGGKQVRIYTFTGGALIPMSTFAHGAAVYGLSIDPLKNLVAVAGELGDVDPTGATDFINDIRILKATVSGVSNCIVRNNSSFFTQGGLFPGLGIALSASLNFVDGNTAFFNDVNEQF